MNTVACGVAQAQCRSAENTQGLGKPDASHVPAPSAAATAAVVASAGTSQGSEKGTMHAAHSQAQGAGAVPAITAAGSGTDATAIECADNGRDAPIDGQPLPDRLPPVWERQISEMIQDAVSQQGLDNSALIECITRNANDVAKAVFSSGFAQTCPPWIDRSAACGPPEPTTGDATAGQHLESNESGAPW